MRVCFTSANNDYSVLLIDANINRSLQLPFPRRSPIPQRTYHHPGIAGFCVVYVSIEIFDEFESNAD